MATKKTTQNRKSRRTAASKLRKKQPNGKSNGVPLKLSAKQLAKLAKSEKELTNMKARHSDMVRETARMGAGIDQRQGALDQMGAGMINALGVDTDDAQVQWRINTESGEVTSHQRQQQLAPKPPPKEAEGDGDDAGADA